MARDSAITLQNFDEMLAWLDRDREVAAQRYLQLREDLANVFRWRGCSDPDGLVDEVFERVAKKVYEIKPNYQGDPRLYFRAVANNLVKENLKKAKNQVSLEDIDLPQPITTKSDEDEAADIEDCLQTCLQNLSAENRKLILDYYAKEKQAKIDHRSELAQQLKTSVQTLRVRVYRVRQSLQECIAQCLKRKDKYK
jgi:RNA polymerase sigma factor (sigma-70 family)